MRGPGAACNEGWMQGRRLRKEVQGLDGMGNRPLGIGRPKGDGESMGCLDLGAAWDGGS